MKYRDIRKYKEVEVFFTPEKEPDTCCDDWIEKRQSWVATHRWQKGVVIKKSCSKEVWKNNLWWIIVSFNEELTRQARKEEAICGLFIVADKKEWTEGVDYITIYCQNETSDFFNVRAAGCDPDKALLASARILTDSLKDHWSKLYHARMESEKLLLANGLEWTLSEFYYKLTAATSQLASAVENLENYTKSLSEPMPEKGENLN